MSTTISITGNKSIIETNFNPPLIFDGSYECGLLYLSSFNSIPNINENNNLFSYGETDSEIKIPKGTYDLQDINDYLSKNIKNCELFLLPNNNTMKSSLFCTKNVNFHKKNSLGELLGFPKVKLEANKWHESVNPVNILPVSVIGVDYDLVTGSYINGSPSHIIYQFIPNVPPGYQFVEKPKNIIYFPIVKNYITSIRLKIVDIHGFPIDFGNKNIQLSHHIRQSK